MPYVLVGILGTSSVIGTVSGLPYTAAVEENIGFLMPSSRIAASKLSEPTVLFCQYNSGLVIDSPAEIFAAKWRTASMPSSLVM
jgi:hypothetical protein